MRFWTKKELLEHLGKDRKDVRLVDRMVDRGEVERVSWGYEYLGSARGWDEVLMKKVKELEEENEKLKQENKELFLESLWSNESSESKDNELQANYEYLQQKFRRLKRGYELVIQLTYKYAAKNMKITKEEYKEQLSEEVNEMLNEEMWRLD